MRFSDLTKETQLRIKCLLTCALPINLPLITEIQGSGNQYFCVSGKDLQMNITYEVLGFLNYVKDISHRRQQQWALVNSASQFVEQCALKLRIMTLL